MLQAGTDPRAKQLCDLRLCANTEDQCLLTGKGPVERNTTSCQDSEVLLSHGWHCQLVQSYYKSHHILLFPDSHELS